MGALLFADPPNDVVNDLSLCLGLTANCTSVFASIDVQITQRLKRCHRRSTFTLCTPLVTDPEIPKPKKPSKPEISKPAPPDDSVFTIFRG